MSDKKPNVISIDGGKNKPKIDDDMAKLIVEGEEIELDGFLLSGCNKDQRRVLLTYNVSLDEMLSYLNVLKVVCEDKIREALVED